MSKISNLRLHLLAGKSITARRSSYLFNYDRLSDGIFVLRKRGMDIVKTWGHTADSRYAIYRLKGSDK